MATPGPLEVEVRYLDELGGWVCGPLADVDAGAVVLDRPVRSFPTYKDQGNYPGWVVVVHDGPIRRVREPARTRPAVAG